MLDPMARRTSEDIPADLRTRLETARLDLLALFRALDRMNLTPQQIPQRLIRQLFELDADYVEALWGLDQPPGKLDVPVMLRDTLAALDQLRSLFPIPQKTSGPSSCPTVPTGTYHPVEAESRPSLQYGPGSRPPKRLSTRTAAGTSMLQYRPQRHANLLLCKGNGRAAASLKTTYHTLFGSGKASFARSAKAKEGINQMKSIAIS